MRKSSMTLSPSPSIITKLRPKKKCKPIKLLHTKLQDLAKWIYNFPKLFSSNNQSLTNKELSQQIINLNKLTITQSNQIQNNKTHLRKFFLVKKLMDKYSQYYPFTKDGNSFFRILAIQHFINIRDHQEKLNLFYEFINKSKIDLLIKNLPESLKNFSKLKLIETYKTLNQCLTKISHSSTSIQSLRRHIHTLINKYQIFDNTLVILYRIYVYQFGFQTLDINFQPFCQNQQTIFLSFSNQVNIDDEIIFRSANKAIGCNLIVYSIINKGMDIQLVKYQNQEISDDNFQIAIMYSVEEKRYNLLVPNIPINFPCKKQINQVNFSQQNTEQSIKLIPQNGQKYSLPRTSPIIIRSHISAGLNLNFNNNFNMCFSPIQQKKQCDQYTPKQQNLNCAFSSLVAKHRQNLDQQIKKKKYIKLKKQQKYEINNDLILDELQFLEQAPQIENGCSFENNNKIKQLRVEGKVISECIENKSNNYKKKQKQQQNYIIDQFGRVESTQSPVKNQIRSNNNLKFGSIKKQNIQLNKSNNKEQDMQVTYQLIFNRLSEQNRKRLIIEQLKHRLEYIYEERLGNRCKEQDCRIFEINKKNIYNIDKEQFERQSLIRLNRYSRLNRNNRQYYER